MKAFAIAVVALLLVGVALAAARITGNGIELNRIPPPTANGLQANRIASNKLAVNSASASGIGVDTVRPDLIGSTELVGVELPH